MIQFQKKNKQKKQAKKKHDSPVLNDEHYSDLQKK